MAIAQRGWRLVAVHPTESAEAGFGRCLRQKVIEKITLSALPRPGKNETGTDSFLTESSRVAGRLLFPSGGGGRERDL